MSQTNYKLTQKIYNGGMKYIKQTIIPLLLLISFLPLSKVNAISLDAEIAKIKSAPPHLRVKLMNQLKMKIWKMRQAQRLRAIRRLRKNIPTSKRVAVHINRDIKHRRENSHYLSNISDDNTISITPIKHRVDIINHHTVTRMAHDLGETHRDIIKREHIVTTHEEHTIDITKTKHPIVPEIPTTQTDITVNNPKATITNIDTDKQPNNKPLDILDNRPSSEPSDMIAETNQVRQTVTETTQSIKTNIDNSARTETSNMVVEATHEEEAVTETTQSIKTNIDNSVQTEASNKIVETNHEEEAVTKTTQETINTNIDNSVQPEETHNIVETNHEEEANRETTQSINTNIDNSTQTDVDIESKSTPTQKNTTEDHTTSQNNNVEVREETHTEEHIYSSVPNSPSIQVHRTTTVIQNSPSSQSSIVSPKMRSLERVYIPNRSRRQ